MAFRPDDPLIVQGDLTVLAEVASPRYGEARDRLIAFAELVKSPEHVHTYRITPLSVWNARSAGASGEDLVAVLEEFSRYPLPDNVRAEVLTQASRYGRLRLVRGDGCLVLEADDEAIAEEASRRKSVQGLIRERLDRTRFAFDPDARGSLKRALVEAGFPARDLAGFTEGEALAISLRETTVGGLPFQLRDYQVEAVDRFHASGSERGGSGVVVLPCGAGKTLVALGAMERVRASTLVLTTSVTAVRQWIAELVDKTDLGEDLVGEYSGHRKEIRPVTVTTYQILTHRESKDAPFTHLGLFDERDWGLIVYDEVHMLPAPVFQATAGLQARRRLGLTATLVREDGLEEDVFALIGPKCVDVPWKELEREGWIAKARCIEVRVPLPGSLRMDYAVAGERAKPKIAAENPDKLPVVRAVLDSHAGEPALVIGTYVDQLRELAEGLDAPLITGSTGQGKRDRLFHAFRAGELPCLVVSKVANFAVDLPDASLAIQVSGTFGSRQEEAQRLGRLLRPKAHGRQASFYSLVTRDTREQQFALKRQLFLCEQGYGYFIVESGDLDDFLSEVRE